MKVTSSPKQGIKQTIAALLIGVALYNPAALAMGKSSPKAEGSSALSQIENLALNFAIAYAQTDPRYAPILGALGIQSSDDVRRLLSGDSSGLNVNSVASYFIMSYSQKNASVAAWLDKLNVHSFSDLQALLKDPGSKGYVRDTLLGLAYSYAAQNPKFSPWLNALNIHSAEDLSELFSGGLKSSNLQVTLIAIGMTYLFNKGKIGSKATSLYPLLNVGSFQGLPMADVAQITALAKKK